MGAADESEALESIREALRGLRFGTVTAIVHDGAVVQVERTEKLRLSKSEPGRMLPQGGPQSTRATSDASDRPT